MQESSLNELLRTYEPQEIAGGGRAADRGVRVHGKIENVVLSYPLGRYRRLRRVEGRPDRRWSVSEVLAFPAPRARPLIGRREATAGSLPTE